MTYPLPKREPRTDLARVLMDAYGKGYQSCGNCGEWHRKGYICPCCEFDNSTADEIA